MIDTMSPDRSRKIESLYNSALQRNPAERDGFLAQACSGDAELRQEVEALLADPTRTMLPGPTAEAALTPGTQLGPYKIEGRLGAGGMGEVFRALDTRLGRPVAIKTSQKQFSERFEREARAISSLNHAHICTLYDVGPDYLVMELVEGETLSARIERSKLSLADTLKYGAQIADALAAAHAKGITHRDLKPHNIMIGKQGAKVLDFGLAKSMGDQSLTQTQGVVGTPAYMAPEQREGKACDPRTDVYALGLVLYEMAAGKRLPVGGHAPFDDLPPQISKIIERCLQHEPDDRWQSAADLRAVLQWAQTSPVQTTPEKKKIATGWIAAILLTILAAGVILFLRPTASTIEAPSQFSISFAGQMANAGPLTMPVPSPDGRFFAIPGRTAQGGGALWIRALNSTEARLLPGTENAEDPIWSPDSRWLAFYADGRLKKINPSGGAPQTIATLEGFQDADWGSGGDILFRISNRTPLYRIRDSGGLPAQVTRLSPTENSHRGAQFLPDGRRFIFTSRCSERANDALYLGSLDSPVVKRLMALESNARYVPGKNGNSGVLIYYRDGGLLAQPFDPDTGKLSGEAAPVIDHVAYRATGIIAGFRISNQGNLAIVRPSGADQTNLTWFERNGDPSGTLGPVGEYTEPRISPDGARVAFSRPDPQTGNRDIFSIEIARGVASRLTTNVANDWFPVWAPDSRQLLFGSDRDGGTANSTYLKSSLDAGSAETRFPGDQPFDWSRDGRWIASGTTDIMISRASVDAKPFPFLKTPFREGDPRFSPDGKWLAYSSNESGRYEVYVRPFNGAPAAPEGKIQISDNGGDFPVWRPQGGELYYMDMDGAIFAVNTNGLGVSNPPKPTRLFRSCPGGVPVDAPMNNSPYGYAYDTADGRRFLVNCTSEPPGRFTVLLNWQNADPE